MNYIIYSAETVEKRISVKAWLKSKLFSREIFPFFLFFFSNIFSRVEYFSFKTRFYAFTLFDFPYQENKYKI